MATADPSATVSWFVVCIERLHDSGSFAVLVIVPDDVIVPPGEYPSTYAPVACEKSAVALN